MVGKIIDFVASLLLNPLTEFFQLIGFNEAVSKAFSAALIILIIWLLGVCLKKLYQRHKNNKTARELVHFRYAYKDVKQKRELFIPTKGQNNSPTCEEEPSWVRNLL